MKILTKSLIGAGVLVPAISGLAVYGSLKSNKPQTTAERSQSNYDEFWGGRVENFKQELIILNKQESGKADKLTEKMFGNKGVLFKLNGEEFYPDMGPQQKLYLSQFCGKTPEERTKLADASLIEKIC